MSASKVVEIKETLRKHLGKTVSGTILATALTTGVIPWGAIAEKLLFIVDGRYVKQELFKKEMEGLRLEIGAPDPVDMKDPIWLPTIFTHITETCS